MAARPPTGDVWAHWLRTGRHGGVAGGHGAVERALRPVRERVLDNARLAPGAVVLDVGTGDGLIGFGALDRVHPGGRVIFSDISPDLLAQCRAGAEACGLADRCDFVEASATDLGAVPDASVDAVTVRSVLIYVDDPAAAVAEAARVLRPGGRLSLFEPMNGLIEPAADDVLLVGVTSYQLPGLEDTIAELRRRRSLRPLDLGALAGACDAAGFLPYRIDTVVEAGPAAPADWVALLATAPNPLAPTFGEWFAGLGGAACARLEARLRPLVEAGAGRTHWAGAYLSAERPAAGAG